MPERQDISPLTLNRLSVYLRCLRLLRDEGVERVSSQQLAQRFHLSSSQIRKDLTYFGEFGVRGVGYDVSLLADRLQQLLGLDRTHRLMIVGVGNLGSALARYFDGNDLHFQVVAGVDSNEQRIGKEVGSFVVRAFDEIATLVGETDADIGVITVPGDAAVQAYEALVDGGVRSVLNFAPVQLPDIEGVRVKNVDMRIHLEEMAFFLGADDNDSER
ncbi:MAG: redox-sensing transcriptional repressor Rex [Acidobacteriota bacterium]